MKSIPQPIPYQGSKRNIAEQIMFHAPKFSGRIIEPFAGSAAITIYATYHKITNNSLINDSYKPLIDLWRRIIEEPEECATQYEKIWHQQLNNPSRYYLRVREEFNVDNDPIKFFFLVARCVKNSIRFNSAGKFNQSADKRRLGRRPCEMRKCVTSTSFLLKNNVELMNDDYEKILNLAKPNDLVYMDPPYQGTSNGKNPRYHQGLDFKRFIRSLEKLNNRRIPFMLSFDGQLGNKKYGQSLPKHLNLHRIPIYAGRSAQATLNGKKEITIESLYLSPVLKPKKTTIYQDSLFVV